jgi:hypothetical protein
MPDNYPFNKEVELELLALYVRRPHLVAKYVEPRYFQHPRNADIARIVYENREKNPRERHLKKEVLYDLVKRNLQTRNKMELWDGHGYKRTIHKIYKNPLKNPDTVADLARAFAQEREWRVVLAEGEKEINARHYDNFLHRVDKVRAKFQPPQAQEHKYDDWPKLNRSSALQGLAGDVVKLIEPESESDPAALLVMFLTAFGNYVSGKPWFRVEATKHHTNLFALIVGETSRSRKGTALDRIQSIFRGSWPKACFLSGLSTGEGLINTIRDRAQGEKQIIDKRRLVVESEFARVLRVQRREANTLSAVLRDAWDGNKPLEVTTRNDPLKATGAHISIIGHITRDELRRELFATEQANGYANRFLFVCARRSKLLPEGGHVKEKALNRIIERVQEAREYAREVGELRRSVNAKKIWRKWYEALPEPHGMLGAITSREAAQVVRLSMIYALLDKKSEIHSEHLKAAFGVWEYSLASARHIFGTVVGDPTADQIYQSLLKAGKDGISRTNISGLFHGNLSEAQISTALNILDQNHLAHSKTEKTSGRPTERWFASREF